MRYLVYDEEGTLMRKFWTKGDAESYLQSGWTIRVLPKQVKLKPTTETHGEARW